MGFPATPPEQRFKRHYIVRPNECWEWSAARDPKGYGRFHIIIGKVELAHRASWVMTNGQIPEGLFVCHHCDNPSCVNPDHLFLGTPKENMADMARKWRTRTKLTPQQVEEIRASGDEYRVLAERYGLASHKSIYNIKRGRTFANARVA